METPTLPAAVHFRAHAAGDTIVVTMHVRLANLEAYPPPAGRYNATVAIGTINRDDEPTEVLARRGWVIVEPWHDNIAVVAPATAE